VDAWEREQSQGRAVRYYGGGTEIITLARDSKIESDVLIDAKHIPETRGLREEAGVLVFGSSVSLNTIVDTTSLGILRSCASGVADRTVRNSITLGGNVCGMLPYREAVLPFLLLDGSLTVVRPGSARPETRAFNDAFEKRLLVPPGSLVVDMRVSSSLMNDLGMGLGGTGPEDTRGDTAPAYGAVSAGGHGPAGGWFYRRCTKEPRLDYPLATVAMARHHDELRLAVTGAWGYPLRARPAEDALNAVGPGKLSGMTSTARRDLAAVAVDAVGETFKQDMRGSREYRRELTVQAVSDGLSALCGEET
jgi:CO/xanthine dehydrogenase FAD-binding subunit